MKIFCFFILSLISFLKEVHASDISFLQPRTLQTCGELCEGCDPSSPNLCSSCVPNASKILDLPFMLCQCNSGYAIEGNSCVSTCGSLCIDCDPSDSSSCLSCAPYASKVDPTAVYSPCECDRGYVNSNNGCILSVNCSSLCVNCDPENKNLCETCVENAVKTNPELSFSECVCDAGFTQFGQSCLPSSVALTEFYFDSLQNSAQGNYYDLLLTGNFLPVPHSGTHFNGSARATLSYNRSTGIEFSSQAFRVWMRLQAYGNVIEISGDLLQLAMDSTGTLTLTGNFMDSPLVGSAVSLNKWSLIGYSVEYTSSSTVSLYVDGLSLGQATYQSALVLTVSSNLIVGEGITGFILNLAYAIGVIPSSFSSREQLCVVESCDIPPGICDFNQSTIFGVCEDCDCNGLSCARPSDCRLNHDVLCYIFISMYTCLECQPRAQIVDGFCECENNTTFNSSSLQCECNAGYALQGDACVTVENYFQRNQINAAFDADLTKIVVSFDTEVIYRFDSCEVLVATSSLGDLGTNPSCSWVSPQQLEITFGSEFRFSVSSLELIPEAFALEGIGSPRDDLVIPIEPSQENLTPTAVIEGESLFTIGCSPQDLILSGEQSTGGTIFAYKWGVSATGSVLEMYLDTLSTSIISIPFSILAAEVYTFSLTVTNEFTYSNIANLVVEVISNPILKIDISPTESYIGDFKLDTTFTPLVTDSCGQEGETVFTWRYEETPGNPQIDSASILERVQNSALTLTLDDLPADFTYNFVVEGSISTISGSETLSITVVKPDLIAVIAKLDGEVSSQIDLILDGSPSYDPYDLESSVSYEWSCTSNSEPCLNQYGFEVFTDTTQGILAVPSSDLAVGASLTFTLTVSTDSRRASTSVNLTVTDLPDSEIQRPESQFNWDPNEELRLEIDDNASGTRNVVWYQVIGNPIVPSTPMVSDFIEFPSNSMNLNQYYAWEARYVSNTGTVTRKLFAWDTNSDYDCDNDGHRKTDGEFFLWLKNCSGLQDDGTNWTFSFGILFSGRYIDLTEYGNKQYIIKNLPVGTYEIVSIACNEQNDCVIKKIPAYELIGRELREVKDIIYKESYLIDHALNLLGYQEYFHEKTWGLLMNIIKKNGKSKDALRDTLTAFNMLLTSSTVCERRILHMIDFIQTVARKEYIGIDFIDILMNIQIAIVRQTQNKDILAGIHRINKLFVEKSFLRNKGQLLKDYFYMNQKLNCTKHEYVSMKDIKISINCPSLREIEDFYIVILTDITDSSYFFIDSGTKDIKRDQQQGIINLEVSYIEEALKTKNPDNLDDNSENSSILQPYTIDLKPNSFQILKL